MGSFYFLLLNAIETIFLLIFTGSSQGFNNLVGPPGPGPVGQPPSGNFANPSFPMGSTSSPTPPPSNGPYQTGMPQTYPGGGQGFPPGRPSPSPMPQMGGPSLGPGGPNPSQPLSNNTPGGLPAPPSQMGAYAGGPPQISGQMGAPPNFGPPGAQPPLSGPMGGPGGMSAPGYPQPPRPQQPPGPGMGYNPSQPPSLNQPGMGPPRPGLPPGKFSFL
jgi:hypothetical protein